MKNKKFIITIALVAALAMCFAACSKENPSSDNLSEEPVVELTDLGELLAGQRSCVLESGESFQLTLPQDRELTLSSSDETVATVDNSGLVTAVGKGMAIITVSDSNGSACCGIVVDGMGSLIDITKLTAKEIFSDLELHSITEITGMAVDTDNHAVYFAQCPTTSSFVPQNPDILISKVEQKADAWELSSRMRFSGSGNGSICMDNDGQTPRLWMECNGDYIGYGKAISLVQWSDEGYGLDTYGQVFKPQGISGGMAVTADVENNMVLVYDRAEKCYRIYNRADMLAGEEAPQYVHSFKCKANQTPAAGKDDSQGRYNASIRGYALYDGYLYQFSGSSSIYLSVFDLEGNLQYCHRLENQADADYYAPASISILDGKIYVAIATGNSEYNLANLLVFE